MSQPVFNNIFGTDADEDLIGKAGADQIFGFAGKDKLYGQGGDDVLHGGTENDVLDGGTGADIMFGGSGDDLYRVDNFADVVSEESAGLGIDDGGIDTVESTITYTLGPFIEKLALTGTTAIDGIGNSLANIIKGNDAANVLSGLDSADDLRGNGGNDTLIGGAGRDTLTGDAGSDTFVLGQADAASTDRITDFNISEDWIGVFATDYGLIEGQGLIGGALDAAYLALVSGTQKQGTVLGHGQFLYNTTSSALMWDADGAGTASAGVALANFSAVNGAPVTLSAGNFVVFTDQPTVTVVNATPDPQPEDKKIYFTISLSAPASQDVTVHYATVGGTATFGSDFVGALDATAFILAGATSVVVAVDIVNDASEETTPESFSLQLTSAVLADGTALSITAPAVGTIVDDAPHVGNIIDTMPIGSTDPSGLAYVPGLGLFLSDSEVDEAPFSRPNNLFQLQTDGTNPVQFSLSSFTQEPTGLAYDPTTGRLYISDDDQFKVFWVDPSNPSVKLGEFNTPIAADDTEDLAIDPNTGHLFIVNGLSHTIVEVDATGAQVSPIIVLPIEISDPEALVYDAQHDVFYVGGDFSSNIWAVDRSGNILDVIDVLGGYPNPLTGTRVHVKDLEFAPTSDPNDDPRLQSLYVADYGNNHLSAAQSDDGRLFEIHLGDRAPLANEAPVVANATADQTATQGAAFAFTVPANTFTDPDVDDTLTLSATLANGSPLPSWLSFNAATGTFSGTPGNGDVGTISLKVTATDTINASISDSFDLVIANTNDAPVMANAIADQAATQGAAFAFAVPADSFADVDVGDSLTLSATLANGDALPAWLNFNAATGTFSGTPGNDDVGIISVQVRATDGSNASVSDTFDLVVSNTNDLPIITSDGAGATAAIARPENTTAVSTVTATDVDAGQTLTYSIAGGADAAKFAINGSTGVLTFATATDYENPTDAGANNIYDVTVQVSDGHGGIDIQAIAVTVQNVVGVTLNGNNSGNTLTGAGEEDTLNGLGGNDTLNGLAGNDLLDGGTGSDRMVGGLGNDIYLVNSSGDTVVEQADQGTDTVRTSTSYTLSASVENLTYTGSGSFTGQGNDLANVITGGAQGDTLRGNGGNDILIGLGGDDTLNGGAGADTLNGGAGNDTMNGGASNDIFVFAANFGNDRIQGFDPNPVNGQDLLDISAIGITSADFASRVSVSDVGSDTLVTIDAVNTILLLGVGNAAAVTQDDFFLL